MARLFIGLDLPRLAPLQRAIGQLATIGPSVRPVRMDCLHVTLRFLGEVRTDLFPAIGDAIDSAVRKGVGAGWLAPFDLELTHLGTFPKQPTARPRIIFAAPQDPGPLLRLAEAIDAQLENRNLPITPREGRFEPHATLARVRRRRTYDRRLAERLPHIIEQANHAGLGTAKLKAVKLIESRPGADGPDYTARHVRRFR